MEIKQKVAVITGAASGIGHATATELASRGVSGMALADRSDSVAEVAAKKQCHPEVLRGISTLLCFRDPSATCRSDLVRSLPRLALTSEEKS